MSSKSKNHGGRRPGAGRKKGRTAKAIYIEKLISDEVSSMFTNLMNDSSFSSSVNHAIQKQIFDDDFNEFVYLIKGNGKYKVGYTSSAKRRFASYRTHLGEFKILLFVKTPNAFNIEDLIVEKYGGGEKEWLDLDQESLIEVLDLINRLSNSDFKNPDADVVSSIDKKQETTIQLKTTI